MPSNHPNCGLSLTTGRPSLCAFGCPYSSSRSRRRSSHPTTKRLLSTLDRSALDFFLLYHSQHGTEDGHYTGVFRLWVGPRSFEVCRSFGVQQRPFVLTSTGPDDLGRGFVFRA